jgi:hypothetical protein
MSDLIRGFIMKKLYFFFIIILFLNSSFLFSQAPINLVCGGDSVTLLVENYDSLGVIEWQESIDTINWATIPEIVGETYKFLPTQTKYYRSVIKTSTSEPQLSAITLVQLLPVANAGLDKVVGGNKVILLGNKNDGSNGEWTVLQGDSGIVSEPSNQYSLFSGEFNIDYKLKWTLSNTCGQSSDTVIVRFEEVNAKTNFIVVDNTDSIYSDSTEMATGIYRIKFSDPSISPQDSVILIGMREDISFLRKVISFTLQDSIYYFTTEQGSFEDLFNSGSIDFGSVINQDIINGKTTLKSASIGRATNGYPTRKTIKDYQNKNDVVLIYSNLNNEYQGLKSANMSEGSNITALELSKPKIELEVYNESLKITLEDIKMSLSPSWIGQLSFRPWNLRVGMDNALFKLDFITKVEAIGRIDSDERSATIYRNSLCQWIIYANGVPIIVDLNFSLKSKYKCSLEGAATLNTQVNYINNFTCIMGMGNSESERSFNGKFTSSLISSSLNAGIHGEMNIGPEISFSFYKIFTVSPYLSLQVKSEMDLKTSLITNNWQLKNKVGLYGYIGAKAVLEQNLFSKEKTLFDIKYSIWGDNNSKEYCWPNKLELVSGDKQKGQAGKVLPNPISFKVTNSFGGGVPLVPVRFELENGNGTIPSSVLYTNLLGQVSLNWTLGLQTESKLKAYVFDYENMNIEKSPINIMAYSSGASNLCENSNLAITLKSTQTYKYPSVTGGTLPYTYSTNGINYSSPVPQFNNSTPGNFNIYVKDKNQCSSVRAFTISATDSCNNSDLTMDIVTLSNTLQITGKKGTPSYLYSIDNQTSFSANDMFNNLAPGVHTIFVKDSKLCIASSDVTIESQATVAIKATYPTQNTTSVPLSGITFRWLAGNYITNQVYDLYLKKQGDSYTKIGSNLTSTSFAYSGTFDISSNYTWKIEVKKSTGETIDFAEFLFSTASSAITTPTIPILLQPANGGEAGIYVTLQWLAQNGDFRYNFYLDEVNATKLMASNLKNPEYTINNLKSGRTYYWKVKVKSAVTGESATSEVWSFTINSTLNAAYEYWFDNDYSAKTYIKTPSNIGLILNKNISTDDLSVGLHSFQIRYKDKKGYWSSVYSNYFQKLPMTPSGERKITNYEYWFDSNYASKTNTHITPVKNVSIIEAIKPSAISPGLHSIHYRFKDDAGSWSSIYSDYIHKVSNRNVQENYITAYRYWFDSDVPNMQSVNLQNPVNPFELLRNINICSFPNGNHTIHFQFKDSNSAWSSVLTDTISKVACSPVPSTQTIQNEIFIDGEDNCFGATQTITVAGSGTTVVFQNGSITNLIAGQSVRLLPGVDAQQGSWLHAYITTNGTYCGGVLGSPVLNQPEEKSGGEEQNTGEKPVLPSDKLVKVYPNPNNGYFTVELTNFEAPAAIKVYNTTGVLIYKMRPHYISKPQISLPYIQKGVYFVQVTSGSDQFIKKIIVK